MKKNLLLFLLLTCVFSCTNFKINTSSKSEHANYTPTPVELKIPPGFPYMIISKDNPTTVEGIQLGRMLFYDPIIDAEGKRSCGQCHAQETSFSCKDKCLPHINLTWNNAFLWDGKINGVLEDIMLFEVERFFNTDLKKLNKHRGYTKLFNKAFGTETITSKEIAYALAQFVRTLISNNSKWDRVLQGSATLSQAEQKGRDIFFSEKGDCFHCHGTILLTDNYFHNNGLDSIPDKGRAEVTKNKKDLGKFKTPTLRNIEFTAPYMHDGRFATLEEVLDFYSEGVKWSATIDPLMKKVHRGGVHLSSEERSNLLAFLKTFSDTTFLNNTNFSNPF